MVDVASTDSSVGPETSSSGASGGSFEASIDAAGDTANEASSEEDATKEADATGDEGLASSEPLGACCGQPEPSCAPGVCCVATDCAADERCLHYLCQKVTCAPVADATFFVDPSAGVDGTASTGAANCPFRTVTRALYAITVARVGLTGSPPAAIVEIVNEGFAPVLGDVSGETFPINVLANVTVVPEDTTKNAPIFRGSGYGTCFESFARGIRLSHLVLDGNQKMGTGVDVSGNTLSDAGDASTVILDHLKVTDFVLKGITLGGEGVTLGPGLTVANCPGAVEFRGGSLTVLGGHGEDHTSFTGARIGGLWVHGAGSVTVAGADIDPAHPDVSDIDTDNNSGSGVFMEYAQGGTTEVVSVRGLHSTGNMIGIRAEGFPVEHVTVRSSYLANNTQSAVTFPGLGNGPEPSTLDLGSAVGPDWGRNVFSAIGQTAAVNTQGGLCLAGAAHVLAAGNIFGAKDCAVGGTLTFSTTCGSQVDIGGLEPDAGTSIDLRSCK